MSTEERCYRLAHQTDLVDVRGDDARDALIAYGYGVVSPIDCVTGAITAQADPQQLAQSAVERAAFEALPEDEKRQLRRQVGAVALQAATPVPDAKWGATKTRR